MDEITNAREDRRVLAAEDEYVAAELACDETALRRLLHEQFVYNASDGTTSDRNALIANILAMDMTGQTISERTVVVDGDTAVICGTTELRFGTDGTEASVSRLRYTATYVERRGRWRMLALQMTRRT